MSKGLKVDLDKIMVMVSGGTQAIFHVIATILLSLHFVFLSVSPSLQENIVVLTR